MIPKRKHLLMLLVMSSAIVFTSASTFAHDTANLTPFAKLPSTFHESFREIHIRRRDGSEKLYFFTNHMLNFTAAVNYCEKYFLNLVMIKTAEDQQDLHTAIDTDGSRFNRWINIYYTSSGWIWGGYDSVSYTNFYSFSHNSSDRHFIIGYPGIPYFNKWAPAPLVTELHAICEYARNARENQSVRRLTK